MEILQRIAEVKIVPTIVLSKPENAVPLAHALIQGGIPCAEVTFRTAEGEDAIRRIAAEVPGILLGAGTVLTPQQVDRAVAAGAQFIVSPGFNPRVVDHCLQKGVPVVPGCITPSEMEQAIERGLTTLKFFPAEAAGGLPFISAVAAPYPMLRFLPTGGVGPANLAAYLAHPKVVACGSSWMVPKDLLDEGRFDEVTRLCRQAVALLP